MDEKEEPCVPIAQDLSSEDNFVEVSCKEKLDAPVGRYDLIVPPELCVSIF